MSDHQELNDFMKTISREMQQDAPQMDETILIREHIDARRRLLAVQEQADNIKAKLCDHIRASKPQSLTDRIARFEYTDAEMYNYIRKLEFINVGIWCPKCYAIKQLQGKPADYERVLASTPAQHVTSTSPAPHRAPVEALSVTAADLLPSAI